MSDPRAADRAEDAAQLLQRLDQHGTLVSLSAQAASVIRALLTERQSLMERVQEMRAAIKQIQEQSMKNFEAAESAEALTVSLRENEGELLLQLSDALSGGNAGTWEEVIHAAVSLRAELDEAKRELETCPDHGPHVGFRYCPECYQRAFTAGQEAALAASAVTNENS